MLRLWHLRGPALVLLLASGMALAGCNSTRNCGATCVRPGLIPARVRRIASLDWRKIDRAAFHREWPEAPVPPVSLGPPQSPSIKGLERDIACCCKAGQGLVVAGFDYPLAETPTAEAPGLWGVEVIVCGPTRKQAVDGLKALVDAVVPEHPKSAPPTGVLPATLGPLQCGTPVASASSSTPLPTRTEESGWGGSCFIAAHRCAALRPGRWRMAPRCGYSAWRSSPQATLPRRYSDSTTSRSALLISPAGRRRSRPSGPGCERGRSGKVYARSTWASVQAWAHTTAFAWCAGPTGTGMGRRSRNTEGHPPLSDIV
jgi:hypothetical protein